MASGVYNKWLAALAKADFDFEPEGTCKVALVAGYTFNKDHGVWSSISTYEVSGTGYTAGGHSLVTTTVTQDDTNDLAKLDAADGSWTTATFSADAAVVYQVADSLLVAHFSFGTSKIVNAGTFTLQWNSDGLINIAQA